MSDDTFNLIYYLIIAFGEMSRRHILPRCTIKCNLILLKICNIISIGDKLLCLVNFLKIVMNYLKFCYVNSFNNNCDT